VQTRNSKQRLVIDAHGGSLPIIAGPGYGKTFTLVERTINIINKLHIEPENILLSSFAEKASAEFLSRLSQLLYEKNISVMVMVLNIPTGDYKSDPKENDLIGFERIMATLPSIISNRFEGAIYPIELANGIASLSSYPSAKVLEIFATNMRKKEKEC